MKTWNKLTKSAELPHGFSLQELYCILPVQEKRYQGLDLTFPVVKNTYTSAGKKYKEY